MKVGVLGASGMIGICLTRMLHAHPRVNMLRPFSRRLSSTPMFALHPALRDLTDLRFAEPSHQALSECDTVMVCGSGYESWLPALRDLDKQVIDFGSAFRLSSRQRFVDVHGSEHPCPEVLDKFVNILPELNAATWHVGKWVANQGCVSTSVALALYPLVRAGLLAEDFVNVDAKVASTGAGNSGGYSQMHFNRCNGVKVYRLLNEHRHAAELEDFMLQNCGQKLKVHINVFSVDMVRGISSSVYVRLRPGTDERAVRRVYNEAYRAHPAVRVLSLATGPERYPNPRWLVGTGLCEIGFRVEPESGHSVLIVALDNLMKGGASQGVQLFNLMNGFAAAEGIPLAPSYP